MSEILIKTCVVINTVQQVLGDSVLQLLLDCYGTLYTTCVTCVHLHLWDSVLQILRGYFGATCVTLKCPSTFVGQCPTSFVGIFFQIVPQDLEDTVPQM